MPHADGPTQHGCRLDERIAVVIPVIDELKRGYSGNRENATWSVAPSCRSVCCRDATEAPGWVANASFISTSGGPVFLLVPLSGVLAKLV